MMGHSGVIGAYAARADVVGRGHSSIGGGPTPSFNLSPSRRTSPATTLNFVPSSAFSSPSNSHSAVAIAAASYGYGSPRSHHHETMLRSSPTSVACAMLSGGGLGGGLPYDYDDDVNSSAPYKQRQDFSLGMRQSGHYYATPAADTRYHHRDTRGEALFRTVAAETFTCLPCDSTDESGYAAALPPAVKFNSPSPTPGVRRRSGGNINQGPGISAARDRGKRSILPPDPHPRQPCTPSPSGGCSGNGSGQPTPQNLRDNPERRAKVKTEMCQYYENGRADNCPWGVNCNYAHGKHELKFRYTTLCLMESSGQIVNAKTHLARPCMTWVSTGACPFGRRCAAIHDPSIAGPLECPSWLPVATSKTKAHVIVDRLAAHRENVVHQENPLIAQSIWENCRPLYHRGYSQKPAVESSSGDAKKSISDMEQEWCDTYALICNGGVSIFPEVPAPASASSKKLSDLQKLCIVRIMRLSNFDSMMNCHHTELTESSGDGLFEKDSVPSQLHQDYVFSPTHSLHSELCMILQARYFILPDVDFKSAAKMSPEGVVKEITFNEFKARTTPCATTGHYFDPSRCVMAHEVAFAPKGDNSANVSIWFDALPIRLVQSQIKRSRRLKQKKTAQIRNEHTRPNANGALISRTSSADFPTCPPDIDPFVPMLPANDHEDSHRLIMAIIEHRIDSIILSNCSFVDKQQKKKMYVRMDQLKKTFMGMTNFHEKWTWPKRQGMGHVDVTTMAPHGNIMPYIPLKTNKKSPCTHIWHTFVKTMCVFDADTHLSSPNDGSKRLSVFLSFDGSFPRTNQGGKVSLPHILSGNLFGWRNAEASSPKKDGPWKEILLGLPENGKWKEALRIHKKKTEETIDNTTKARNMPLSTIPFVQP